MSTRRAFASLCTDLLQAGQPVCFRASGSSMAPTLRDGDLVTVAPVRVAEVRSGDVLLYATARGLTAHRVLQRLPGGSTTSFRTRGDAPGSAEEQIEAGQVLGRVEAVRRNGRERRLQGRLALQLLKISRPLRRAALAIKARLPARSPTGVKWPARPMA